GLRLRRRECGFTLLYPTDHFAGDITPLVDGHLGSRADLDPPLFAKGVAGDDRVAARAARCLVPECGGISQADPAFREGLWARYFTAAPRPRTPSELRYSDRRLRSRN